MDRLDRMLVGMKPEIPEATLADRLCSQFRHRYQRARRMYLGLMMVFMVVGCSLVLPQAFRLSGTVDLPENGLVVVGTSMGAFASPLEFWNTVSGSIYAVQNGLLGALQTPFWIGLFGLAMGAMMGMGWLLPTGKKE